MSILIAMDDGETSRKINKQVAHRYKRSVKLPKPEKCKSLKANMNKDIFVRHKRGVSIDPIDAYEANEEYSRAKRRVVSAFQEYSQCRKNVDGDEKSCEAIHQKILKLANEFSAKFSMMKDLMENFKLDMDIVDGMNSGITSKKNSKNIDENSDIHLSKNAPMRPVPRFHEDLSEENDPNANKLKTVEDFLRNKQKPIDPKLGGVDTSVSAKTTFRDIKNPNDKSVTPLKNGNFGMNKINSVDLKVGFVLVKN